MKTNATKRRSKYMLLLLLISITGLQMRAESKVWVGGLNGNWNDPLKWSPYGVPSDTSDVYIGPDGYIVNLNNNVTIRSLELVGWLVGTADMNISGNMTLQGDRIFFCRTQ